MKRKFKIITTASAASLLALTALAQHTPNPSTDRTDSARDEMAHARRADRLNGAAKASDLIGMEVKNYQGEKLGKVDDLAIDVESGRIVDVILSTGGFLGVGDSLHAVPPGALHHDVANKVVHLDADKEKLKAAPKFQMSNWAGCCESNYVTDVYRYYGEQPYFTLTHRGDAPNTVAHRNKDGTWEKDRIVTDASNQSWSRLGYVQKASKVMGMSVKNVQDEKLGKVENLMLDLPAGRVVAVIISSGGFLGMGDEMSAVPPTALKFNTERDVLQLDASKDMLSSAPHFKSSEWPDLGQPSYADGVYRSYHVEPYFTTNAVADANNTVRNVRDRNNQTLTPFDQGKSSGDRDITTRIRKEVVASSDLSTSAHNVKIITTGGRVTLRGPVNTADEKRILSEIATRVAGSENVDNQLEIKVSPVGRN